MAGAAPRKCSSVVRIPPNSRNGFPPSGTYGQSNNRRFSSRSSRLPPLDRELERTNLRRTGLADRPVELRKCSKRHSARPELPKVSERNRKMSQIDMIDRDLMESLTNDVGFLEKQVDADDVIDHYGTPVPVDLFKELPRDEEPVEPDPEFAHALGIGHRRMQTQPVHLPGRRPAPSLMMNGFEVVSHNQNWIPRNYSSGRNDERSLSQWGHFPSL